MKENEIPEKIYIGLIPNILGGYVYTTVNKDFSNAIEYTRIDAFIDKACSWLKENAYFYVNDCTGSLNEDVLIDEFRAYMKKEYNI